MNSRVFSVLIFCLSVAAFYLFSAFRVQAATCSITTDTVIDQAGVDAGLGLGGGACTDIEINGNVSTTWIGTVDLNGGGTGTVTVKSTYTMTMGSSSNMILGSTDDFVVEANATATHLVSDTNGLKITARNVTISGTLSAEGKGCPSAAGGGDNGFGVNVATGACVYQTGGYGRGGGGTGAGGGGGSHAGIGGGGGPSGSGGSTLYGDAIYPNTLGSGGGTGYYGTAFGGAGGGIIHVTSTGTLTVNGVIKANGQIGNPTDGGYNGGGGGAGGSILIRAGVLAGSGSISADGGDANPGGGGGGGGRVSVRYDSLAAFVLSNISAVKGSGGPGGAWGNGVDGGVGTTFILNRVTDDGAGTLTITSGFDFPAEGDYTRDTISISSGVSFSCSTTTSLTVSSTAALTFTDVTWSCPSSISSLTIASATSLTTVSSTFSFSSATSLSLIAPSWSNVTTTITQSQSGSRATFDIGSSITLRDFTYTASHQGDVDALGSLVVFPNAYGLSMVSSTIYSGVSSTVMTSLSIDSRSSINASAKGCPGSLTTEDGFGPDTSSGVCGKSVSGYGRAGNGGGGGGGGGAHAGTGGAGTSGGAAQTTTYGSQTLPILAGSGGGGGYWQAPAAGGNGGGRVFLVVSGSATVDGSIKSDGGTGLYSGSWNAGGGGSGGSIYLRAATLAGSGSITANGGDSQTNGGGGGGGGRISLAYSSLTFSGTSSTTAGTGGSGSNGSDGSIYTLLLNQSPDTPSSLGQTALTNGSTTGTNTPVFTFTLSDPDVDTVQYRIQIDDSSNFASPVVDYTSALAAEGTRSFQVGQAAGSGAYTVGSVSQTLSNGSYYWRVKTIDAASAESSYTTANSGAVAFSVDATPRYLRFADSQAYGLESITATSIRILLDTSHFETVSVSYAVTENTATGSGTDFTLSSGTVTIPSGNTTGTISLSITDDTSLESEEYLVITLSSPQYATIGSNTSTSYIIIDNDQGGSSSGGSTTGGGGTSAGSGSGQGSLPPPSSFSFVPPLSSQLPVSSAPLFSEPDSAENSSPQTPPASESSEAEPSSHEGTSLIQILNPRDPVRVAEVLNGGERDLSREASARSLLSQDTRSLRTPLSPELQTDLSIFLTYGTSPLTAHLGEGERRAIIRDWLDTAALTNLSSPDITRDFERMTRGALPTHRNLSRERAQLPRVQATFRTIYGHNPDFQNPEENLAWNTLMYRIRFDRDLTLEREGITEFRRLFGRAPQDPFQWSVVRVLGYVDR